MYVFDTFTVSSVVLGDYFLGQKMEQNCQDGEKVETHPRMLPPGWPWDCRSVAAKSIWRHTAYS